MPHVTFAYPCIGREPGRPYVRSWQMQPLAVAVLSGLTPSSWNRTFYDDRLENVVYGQPTDLAAISIETFTARRGYQIAAEFRKRGVPVVMGGYHATSCPDEVLQHADAVCVGDAETVWSQILDDTAHGRLRGRYVGSCAAPLTGLQPDRGIFSGKNYVPLTLVETGRGCPFSCNFCSVTSFYQATYRRRPPTDVIAEIRQTGARRIFFVDDNLLGDAESALELFAALKPLKIRWVTQASIHAVTNPRLLAGLVESGCVGLLIGFESLSEDNLKSMGKRINRVQEYSEILSHLRRTGISVYGTFVIGYPGDTPELVEKTVHFARAEKILIAAFNHLIPFPGTPLYEDLRARGRLRETAWWLSENYRFGQAPFDAEQMTGPDIERCCHKARRRFYSLPSILQRGLDFRANCRGAEKGLVYFGLNLLLRKEVSHKRGIPLGIAQ
jgi:radical SAM superfamily enzyme YgiQ (UPF0313 family)